MLDFYVAVLYARSRKVRQEYDVSQAVQPPSTEYTEPVVKDETSLSKRKAAK